MTVQTANEAIENARRTTTNDPGMCLWYTQEWCETPHQYPDATAQWEAAKYKHAGDRNPPAGAPVSWTGGSQGHGHSALSVGGGKIRTIDQQSSGKTTEVPLSEIENDWGLTYKGWHEDLGGVRLPYLAGGGGPTNPNDVEVGDEVYAIANGGLNVRDAPDGDVVGTLAYGDKEIVLALDDGWADVGSGWASTDYLWPIMADQPNPNGVKAGDDVVVTASGGLKARTLPGGPQTIGDDGKPLVRPEGYTFDVTAVQDGWVSGGTNWYSAEYLDVESAQPGWTLFRALSCSSMPGSVSYLQAGVLVGPVDSDDGHWDECWLVAQDYNNEGDTRFHLYDDAGAYQGYMTVNNGGHGQSFHAYRSAAGNLWVWTLIGDVAYRIRWRKGASITTSSDDVIKQDYKGRRPVGSFEHYVGFRSATDTEETLSIHDRFGFTDGSVSTSPLHEVKIPKQDNQQSWAVSLERIYRFYGKTNEDSGSGSKKHLIDVWDWSGRCLLNDWDVTDMFRSGCTEDEPEGITFTGEPGSVLAGKREGPASASKRAYVWWMLSGLP